MPNPTIILSPRGSARREVLLTNIQVPDLWHLAQALSGLNQSCKHIRRCPLSYVHQNWAERDAQMVLETWHLAYDLLDHLQVQNGLVPPPRGLSEQHQTLWDRLLAPEDAV